MRIFTDLAHPDIVRLLSDGAIGIVRTDTLYGIIAVAHDEMAVERVFAAKGRSPEKSPIVLIADRGQMDTDVTAGQSRALDGLWPGKVSVILETASAPSWLERGNKSVAYRMPDTIELLALLVQTGPVIAPSANPEGEPPAMTIDQAINYFGEAVDFYVDSGTVTDDTPSQLIRLNSDGNWERLR